MQFSIKSFFAASMLVASSMSQILFACNITLNSGDDIQAALNTSGVSSVCLSPGVYLPTSMIIVGDGQSLIGTGGTADALIVSAASRVVLLGNNATVGRLSIRGDHTAMPEYGVLVYASSGATAWGLNIQKTLIGLSANYASNISFLSNAISQNGVNGNGVADPSIYIANSTNINIQYGEIYGDSSTGGGDGEISAYDSTGVNVNNMYINWSGAAGVYMVNCDSCSVTNSFIRYTGEYGLDIVGGSHNFVASNNEISNTRYGAAVYESAGGSTAQFSTNTWFQNGTPGCSGVAVLGDSNNVTMIGNVGWKQPNRKC